MHNTGLRAGLYLRVSKDTSGEARSPREQEQDARRDCKRQGWHVVELYEDVRGASRHSRGERADYARLKADVAAGKVDVLVAWEASRLQRDLRAYGELADLCRTHGVRWSYNGRLFDLDDPDDEFTTGLDALLASREAGVTRKRVKRALAANAVAGRVHGKVQYGYRRRYDPATKALLGQEPDPITGPIITELFRRVADGESFHSLAAEMGKRQVPTARGGPWNPALLGALLKHESYLGRRTHHGQVTAEAAWPALTDEPTFYKVLQLRASRTRQVVGDGRAVHLLTGVVCCAVCGGRITHDARKNKPGEKPSYACHPHKHVTRSSEAADDVVKGLVLGRLSRPNDRLTVGEGDRAGELAAAVEAASDLRARLAALEDDAVSGKLSGAAFGRIEARLLVDIAKAEWDAQAATVAHLPRQVRELTEGDVQAGWDALDVEGRRTVVKAVLVEPKLLRRRGSGLPADVFGLSFRWAGSEAEHVV